MPLLAVNIRDPPRSNENDMEVLVGLFTTPVEDLLDAVTLVSCDERDESNTEINMHLRWYSQIGLVHQVLNRIYASPTRQYAMSGLDFSSIIFDDEQLADSEVIATRCHKLYTAQNLRL